MVLDIRIRILESEKRERGGSETSSNSDGQQANGGRWCRRDWPASEDYCCDGGRFWSNKERPLVRHKNQLSQTVSPNLGRFCRRQETRRGPFVGFKGPLYIPNMIARAGEGTKRGMT